MQTELYHSDDYHAGVMTNSFTHSLYSLKLIGNSFTLSFMLPVKNGNVDVTDWHITLLYKTYHGRFRDFGRISFLGVSVKLISL